MKVFAQFWHLSTGYVNGTIPPIFLESEKTPTQACGTNAVLSLDARYTLDRHIAEARRVCKQRGFIGFSIERGDFRKSSVTVGFTWAE